MAPKYRPAVINDLPGFIILLPGGEVDQTMSFEIVDGLIHRIYVVAQSGTADPDLTA
jgi:hypothetical protein